MANVGQDLPDLELLGRLLALVAHDLRNPLSALHSNLGFLGAALQTSDPDVLEALSDGLVSCDGLSHIIDNVELLSRLLRGNQGEPASSFSAREFAHDALQRCEALAGSHGLSVKLLDRLGTRSAEIRCDREVATRCLCNLVRNSIQHSPHGSVVEVVVSSNDTKLQVLVRDTGSALAQELWPIVFTAQGQVVAKSQTNGRYSRGMGLYAAALAARFAGVEVRVVPCEKPHVHCFELTAPLVE